MKNFLSAHPSRLVPVLACAFFLALAAGVPSPSAAADPTVALEQPITLELERADLAEVLGGFASITGAELDLAQELAGEVTLDLESVAAGKALDQVCRAHGCRWRLASQEDGSARLEVRAAGDAIRIELRDADLRETLESFGRIAGVRTEIDPSLEGTVSLDVDREPWSWALTDLCAAEGCAWVLDEEAGVLRVTPAN